jgi:hypothetical protein
VCPQQDLSHAFKPHAAPQPPDSSDAGGALLTTPAGAGGDAGGEQTSRRGLLRRIVTGVGFSALSLVVVTILSFPRLERVAYLNFSLLFVDGTLLFGNKLLQAILSNDWATVAELTREAGPLDEGIMQPMFFFAAGNADDVQFTARISVGAPSRRRRAARRAASAVLAAAAGADAQGRARGRRRW